MGCSSSKAEEEDLSNVDCRIFLFVNGTSGGQAAGALLTIDPDLKFRAKKSDRVINVLTYDLRNSEKRSAGFQRVKSMTLEKENVRVIACGGDGTVKWCISELSKVDALQVPIGVIPFGTGNDFSRAMGWGASAPSPLLGSKLSAFKTRMEMVAESAVSPLDTWLCELTVRDDGKFTEVKDGKIVETHKGQKAITHEMINYFSLGADAQIVYQFEQNRTSSQLGNKWVYVKKGLGQVVFRPLKMKRMLTDEAGLTSDHTPLEYNKSDRVMAFLNIPSYAAGGNPWRGGKGRNGAFSNQYVGDKKLEALTVHNTSDMATHIATGNSSRVGITRVSQKDSYELRFVDKQGLKVYMQVDGEALCLENPLSACVRHGYQVNVLRSPKAKARPVSLSVKNVQALATSSSKGPVAKPLDPVDEDLDEPEDYVSDEELDTRASDSASESEDEADEEPSNAPQQQQNIDE